MKTKINALLLALASFALFPFAPAKAATLHLQDTVIGTEVRLPFNDINTRHTMHYYFITALVGAPWTSNLCLTVDGLFNTTSLDFLIASRPDSQGRISTRAFMGLQNSAPCDQHSGFLPAGQYLTLTSPRNSNWGSGSPLVPFEQADAEFNSFTYDFTFDGEVRLDAIWKGNLDGTWDITVIPEPAAAMLTGFGVIACAAGLRRRVLV